MADMAGDGDHWRDVFPSYAERSLGRSGASLYGFAWIVFLEAMLTALIGAGLRWLIARSVWRSLQPPLRLRQGEIKSLRAFDQVIACVLGTSLGLFLSLVTALSLRGAQGGLTLHLVVFGVATFSAVWVFRNAMGHARVAAVAALTVVATLAALGGTVWPAMINAKANDIMPGLPRCLRVLDRPAAKSETMLFTLPTGEYGSPGLTLTVMVGDRADHFRWSYRANNFVRFETFKFGDCPPDGNDRLQWSLSVGAARPAIPHS